MSVFMYQIYDRICGFKVMAVVAETEEEARAVVCANGGHFRDNWRRGHAQLVDSCSVGEGHWVEMEFEE